MFANPGPTSSDAGVRRPIGAPTPDAPTSPLHPPAYEAPTTPDTPTTPNQRESLDDLLHRAIVDSDAFGLFYASTVDEILQFFRRRVFDVDLSADLAAETFAQLLRNVRKFDPTRGSARQYLYGIARNHYLLWQRKGVVSHRHRHAIGMVQLPTWDALEDDTIERLDAARLRRRLHTAMSMLTPPERIAIELRILNGCSYADIAATLDCSEVAARVRVSRGLAKLAAFLDEERPT